jgi:alpha-beta hydrolase superfamily lysophospholipase
MRRFFDRFTKTLRTIPGDGATRALTESPGMMLPAVLITLGLILLSGCTTPPSHAETYPQYRAMRAELAPLRLDEPVSAPTIRSYYRSATDGLEGISHIPGTIPALGGEMAVHVWQPATGSVPSRGTVFVIHGYLAHPLQHAALIRRLLEEGYTVVAPELPGHALSDGERGGIDDFSDYGRFLAAVTHSLEGAIPEPWHAVGHSTGATTIYEFLRQYPDPFASVVFVAPLVRSRFYRVSRVGRFLSRPFLDEVSTGYDDPLGVQRMPLSWFDAQVAWNRRLPEYPQIPREILVLQGTADHVVAWRYNRRALTDAFSEVEYQLYPWAGHVLFRAEPAVRDAAVDRAVTYIMEADAVGASSGDLRGE